MVLLLEDPGQFPPTQSAIDALISQIAFFLRGLGIPPLFFTIEVCLGQVHGEIFLQFQSALSSAGAPQFLP
jgi:hypothetical protein